MNLIYLDESGFSGNLPVNYSWIKVGVEKCIEKNNDHSIKVNSLCMFNLELQETNFCSKVSVELDIP
jgi:hypothetical protein